MYSWKFGRQLQSVSYFSNSLYNWIRSDVPWAKFSYHPKSHNSLGWRDSEKYLVAYLEFKRPASPVSIALLAALGSFHPFLDYSYFIYGALD